ncbi:hypothetical protein QWY75_13090 [Pontixanthobacter aestiaquae]|uniref:Uncharacterized protein n=1 Tax=Pontixanthobacter aestiaquae TaxID=1509367 RepID=A0A844Z527_9SPHN|nr:hypothetical protein [Pontixanthobacter aestiaquae]MDN3647141.1 hypothetical protein [Pontixanthobacter aestiaquae]MXO81883.1 hypothetical protein [Pontixanthobacter aestiaquae]
MHITTPAKALIAVAALTTANSVQAAPLTFDCDARTDASSSVQNLAQATPAVSGTITAKQFRRGNLTPAVGASIAARDGSSFATFRLIAATADATEFDIMFNTNVEGIREDFNLGKMAIAAPISFRLFIDGEGVANLFLNNQSWRAAFTTLSGGEEMTYCSTGQFEFSDLRFSD